MAGSVFKVKAFSTLLNGILERVHGSTFLGFFGHDLVKIDYHIGNFLPGFGA
jgi:hypothetical protein